MVEASEQECVSGDKKAWVGGWGHFNAEAGRETTYRQRLESVVAKFERSTPPAAKAATGIRELRHD